MVFNTKTSVGTFNNANGIAQLGERGARNLSMFGGLEPDVYFYGQQIEKIGSDKYRITKGGFTTCVQPTARWEIVSGSATLRLDHYVMLSNAVVEVKNVPVFYLPMLYYPIQEDDRATGFLMPMYGSSLATGSSISNAFFWAINRSQDATFFHDWMFSRGNGLGAEYRYLLGPQAQGDFRYYWLDEKEAVINGQTRQPRQSKSIRGGLSQNLPFGLSARGARRLRHRRHGAPDLRPQLLQRLEQHALVRRRRLGRVAQPVDQRPVSAQTETFCNSTQFDGDRTDAGIHGGVERRAARAAADLRHRQRRGRSQRADHRSGNGDRLDLSLMKADVTPSIRAPLSTLPFLQVNATASYRTTYYSESLADDKKTQIEVPVTRNYGDMRVDVIGPVLSRVFNPNNAIADRMKHVIEPSFSVQRRTEIANQDRIPTATGYDIIVGGVTQMSYGLTNRVMVRKDKEGEPQASAPREMLNVSLRQSYYTDENASKFDTSYSYGYSSRAANAVLADRAGRARDADRCRWRSTTGSNTTRWRCPAIRSCSA